MASPDPSMMESNYSRHDADFYRTEPWITELLCQYMSAHFPHVETILEPACGQGHMSRVFQARGYDVHSYDLVDRGFGTPGVNFLTTDWSGIPFDAIVTNPPYGTTAREFVRKGLSLIEGRPRVMGMVLRNEWDCAKGNMDLFADSEFFHSKLVFTKRPHWIDPAPGEKQGAPRHSYCAFFWKGDKVAGSLPTLAYAHPSKGYQLHG